MIRYGLMLVALLLGNSLCGQNQLSAVAFNYVSTVDGALMRPPPLDEYGIVVHSYWPDKEIIERILATVNAGKELKVNYEDWAALQQDYRPLDGRFVSDLAKSQLLYLGQYTGGSAAIPFKKYPEAIKEFLARGGTIFFDYFATTPSLNDFLTGIKVTNPSVDNKMLKPGDYAAIAWGGATNMALLNTPHKIRSDKTIKSYGWWEKWADNQCAPIRNSREPEKRAALIMQENVLGKGRIIFNQAKAIFGGKASGCGEILENVLSYIYGENINTYRQRWIENRGGPGEPAKRKCQE